MAKYRVIVAVTEYYEVYVNAEDEEDAEDMDGDTENDNFPMEEQ